MAAPSLRHGDLVWGKLGRYPPWPGKIVNPPKDLKKPRGKKCLFVKFFGTEDHAWIKVEQLKPYHPHKEEMIKANKGKRFQVAVDAVEEFLKKAKAKEQSSSDDKSKAGGKKSEGKKADGKKSEGKKSEGKKSEGKKSEGKKSEGKTKKPTGERKRKSSETAAHSSSKKPRDQSPRKRGRPPKDKEEKGARSPEPSSLKKLAMKTVSRFSWPPPSSEQFTRGRYDLSTPAAQNTVVRRVQAILRTEYRRVLTPKQVQVMWSDLKRRDQDLLKRVVAEMESGNAPPQPRDPQPHRAARAARPSSPSSSPGPSHHSEQVARRQAGSLQYVSLSSHLKVRREMRRLRQRLRRQERGVPTRDFKILQQQVLELRERSARQEEEIAQLKGTGGRRDA